MRLLVIFGAALLTSTLPACIHLPAKVAAVVNQSDPASTNNFRRDAGQDPGHDKGPHQAAANAKPAAQ